MPNFQSGDPRSLITAIGAELEHQRVAQGGVPRKPWAQAHGLGESQLSRLERGLENPTNLEEIVEAYAKGSPHTPPELWREIIERFIEARYVTAPERVKRAAGRGRAAAKAPRRKRGQGE